MRKTWLWLVAAVLIAGSLAAGLRAYGIAVVGSGYSAEILCGAVFISGREPGEVEADDLSGPGLEPLQFFRKRVDRDQEARDRLLLSAWARRRPCSATGSAARASIRTKPPCPRLPVLAPLRPLTRSSYGPTASGSISTADTDGIDRACARRRRRGRVRRA